MELSSIDVMVDNLSFSYPGGVEALRGVSLAIQAGECIAIVGQNGAGKTTLVKHFNGLLKPGSGQVVVGGWDTRTYTTARLAARVGYVFQNPDDQLFQATVAAEAAFGPKRLGWDASRVAQQAQEALRIVEMSEFASRHPYDLSPGRRKRLALAAVLAMDTPIIILDEPTTGQDYQGVELVGRIVDELRSRGKTVITVTHDIDFCSEHFGRVIGMARGRVVLDGPARQVLAQSDVLADTYVEPPQLIRLAARLGIEATPLDVEEFLAARYPNR